MLNNNNLNLPGMEKGYIESPETCMCKLLLGVELTEEEKKTLAKYPQNILAEFAINVTSERLNSLRNIDDPTVIINAAAVMYGEIFANAPQQAPNPKSEIFQANLKAIENIRLEKQPENGPTR